MPLFSSNSHGNNSIAYSAMEREPSPDDDDSHAETIVNNGIGTGRSSDDIHAGMTQGTPASSCIEQSNKPLATYTGPEVTAWPTAPRKLRGFSVPLFVGDVVLMLIPVAFLVLGIWAWRIDGKPLSGAGDMIERAMALGPTLYPLTFAAIGSRCLRSIAVRLAERGTTIATLEKLLGSQSLISAIGTAFTLRSASVLSICILSLWILSPLGGQSSLRLLHHANLTSSENSTIYYSDHDAPINPDETSQWLSIVPAILAASLASSAETKDLPVDLWNHPKIPRLEAIEQHARDDPTTEGDWIEVNRTASQKYSSWAGVNVQNLRKRGHANFQVTYNYLYLDCEKYYSDMVVKVVEHMWASNLTMYPPIPSSYEIGRAENVLKTINGEENHLSFFLQWAYPSDPNNKFTNDTQNMGGFKLMKQPMSLLYGTTLFNRKLSEIEFQVFQCAPHVVTLDAQINCQDGNCVAARLRHVPGPSILQLGRTCDSYFQLGCLTFGTYALMTYIRYLPQMLATAMDSARLNPFDDWIMGNNVTYSGGYVENEGDDDIREAMTSERLGVVLNTFWQGMAWGPQITRAGLFSPPEFPNKNVNTAAPERWVSSSDAIFSEIIPVYKADVGWIISLLLITTVLLLLGIVNVAFSFTTIAPDLFYYASSLARENPYTNTPDGGTAIDGGERSRLLKGMKVQIADVSPENQVGYVVMKSVDDIEDFKVGRLKKDRLYW